MTVGCDSEESGQSSDTRRATDAFPFVEGLTKTSQLIDDSSGLRSAVKVWFPRPAMRIISKSCTAETSTYAIEVDVFTLLVVSPSEMRLNLELRTTPHDNPLWYFKEYTVSTEEEVIFRFDVTVPTTMNLFMDFTVVGAKDGQKFTGRHFDIYNASADGPTINSEMCHAM